jgi:hypothetical protein
MAKTVQDGIKTVSGTNITNYSLFLGGLNVRSEALKQYTPLKTGYARIFLVKMPLFMDTMFKDKTTNFKHLIEYGFVGVDGIQNLTMDFEQVTGGYAGKQFDVATIAKDETNEITIKAYEFAGSPIREYTETWITGVSDPLTGIAHYHGAMEAASPVAFTQANHTMEAIYVNTDPTGLSTGIEYACLLANMMPKQVKKDQFNYEAGNHAIVQVDLPFTAVKYESAQINAIAKALVKKFKVRRNYVNFASGYTNADPKSDTTDTNIANNTNYPAKDFSEPEDATQFKNW